jgi:hypothetical protein
MELKKEREVTTRNKTREEKRPRGNDAAGEGEGGEEKKRKRGSASLCHLEGGGVEERLAAAVELRNRRVELRRGVAVGGPDGVAEPEEALLPPRRVRLHL